MGKLILVRHGQSEWNLENRFTGWVDVPLSDKGVSEALKCGDIVKSIDIDIAFTSRLARAQETLYLIIKSQDKAGIILHDRSRSKVRHSYDVPSGIDHIPIHVSEKINERHYGDLQGRDKDEMRKKFGKEQVFIWRRSYDIAPPNGESLKDTYKRSVPYFRKNIMPHIEKGKNVIVSAHGNSLRSIIKYIEGISDNEIPSLELPTGKPIIYSYSRGKLKKM